MPALHPLLRGDRRRPVHRPDGARRPAADRRRREDKPFHSYFSGNTIQICPVGALTGAPYRFRARPFDLVSTPERVRALRVRLRPAHRHRRGKVLRRLAGNDPAVNEEWNCDKGRWAFRYVTAADRITRPLVRERRRRAAPRRRWTEALAGRRRGAARRPRRAAASACWPAGGSPSRTPTRTPSSPGSRWAPTTSTSGPGRTRAEELEFLAAHVVGQGPERLTYTGSRPRPRCCCVGAGAGGGGPILFLRLRKACAEAPARRSSTSASGPRPAVQRDGRRAGSAAPPPATA